MKATTKLRLVGGLILLFNLWMIGQYNIGGIPALLMTVGFALVFEFVFIRRVCKAPEEK